MSDKRSQGKKILNLYGYTGSATVHALMKNAISTTTVDISEAHLQRARANIPLNGFGGPQHITVEKDCIEWLERCREQFALIFVDPPTFSTNRNRKISFSIKDDHEKLLQLCMQRLSLDGVLIFSTSFRNFSMADSLQRYFDVQEITSAMIPEDFKNSPQTRRCWELRPLSDTEEL